MNIYDQPAQANFINTYSPIPFQEIVQAGTARQGRYDAQIAGLEGMVTESELLKAMPGDDESYVQGVQNTAKEIANSFAKRDLSDPYVAKDLRDTIRKSIDKGMLSIVQESYVGYKQHQDLYNKQKAAGLALAPEDLSKYSTVKTGQVFSGLPQQRLDYVGSAIKVFGNLDTLARAGTLGGVYSGVHNEITTKHIQNRAKTAATEWLESPEGEQYVNEARKTGDTRTPQAIAEDFMVEVGMPQLTDKFQVVKDTSDKKGPAIPTRFAEQLLAGQSLDKTTTNYKDAMKNIEKVNEEIADLERVALRTKDPRQQSAILAEIDSKRESIAYTKNLEKAINKDITSDIFEKYSDIRKGKLLEISSIPSLYTKINGEDLLNYIEDNKEEVDRTLHIGKQGIYDLKTVAKGLGKRVSAALTSEEYSHEGIKYSTITKIYKAVNPNGDYKKDLNLEQQGQFINVVKDYVNKLNDLEKYKNVKTKETWEFNVNKELKESVINISDFISISGNGNGSIRLPDGDLYPSGIYSMIKSSKLDRYGMTIVARPGVKDEDLSKFEKSSDIKILYMSNPADEVSPYLVFATTDLNKEGKEVATGNSYKMYMSNPTQVGAVVTDLLNAGQSELAMRWSNYPVYQRILKGFKTAGNFEIPIGGGSKLIFDPVFDQFGSYFMSMKDNEGNVKNSPAIYSSTEQIFYDLLLSEYGE